MKKVYGFIALALVASFALAGAVTNTVTELTPFGDQFRAKVVAVLEAFEAGINANYSTVNETGAWQTDTNVATDATGYTPRFYGDILVGGHVLGGVTNLDVWFADGTTTNDWLSLGTRVQTAITLAAQQHDTNAATDLAEYTPRYVGDILTGMDGGTGTIWVSTGTTTSDWQQLFTP